MNSGLQALKFTLPAGTERPIPVNAGRFFSVKEASAGVFEISLDDGGPIPWDSGMGYAVEQNEKPFQVLTIINRDTVDITFQIIVGAGRVYDQRLTVVADRINSSLALDGADGTGIAAPDGGVGIRGFLSGIYDRLKTAGPLGALLTALAAQLPATLGQKVKAGSLSVTIASDEDPLPVTGPLTDTQLRSSAVVTKPAAKVASITSVQTAAVGTDYTAFAAAACTSLSIANNTGTTIEYRRGAAGTAFPIFNGQAYLVEGITDASQISVRRTDTSNVQVTVNAEAKS